MRRTMRRTPRSPWLRLLKPVPCLCHASPSVTTAGFVPEAPKGRLLNSAGGGSSPGVTTVSRSGWDPRPMWEHLSSNELLLSLQLNPCFQYQKNMSYRQHMLRSQNWEMALYLTRFPTDKTCSNCGVIGWCSIAMNSVFRTMQMVMAKSTKGSITIKFTISFSFIQ